MKTVKQWLNTLPEPLRSSAIEQADDLTIKCNTLSRAIFSFRSWTETKEGYEFWRSFDDSLIWAEEEGNLDRKIYVSGKITGMSEEEAGVNFEMACLLLGTRGWIPVNPMTITHDHDLSWESYMREDIKAMLDCRAVYMLSNWKDSRGRASSTIWQRCWG